MTIITEDTKTTEATEATEALGEDVDHLINAEEATRTQRLRHAQRKLDLKGIDKDMVLTPNQFNRRWLLIALMHDMTSCAAYNYQWQYIASVA